MNLSNRLGLLTALGFALTSTVAYSQGQPAEPAPGGPFGGPPHHPPLGEVLNHLIETYDVNHDGQLDPSELAALRKDIEDGKIGPPSGVPGPGGPGALRPGGPGQRPGFLPKEILDKYDVNKDGRLDETERAALHQDIQDGKIQLPQPGRGPQAGGPPGFGQPPSARDILARFDADKDGKLDEVELTAFLESRPHRPGGPPGRFPGAPRPGNELPQPPKR